MSDNAEGGIARIQAKAAQTAGLGKYHKTTVGYLNERILVFIFMAAFIGLVAVWAMASSPFVLYGSLLAVILLAALWGVVRIKRIQQVREQRARDASEWKSDS